MYSTEWSLVLGAWSQREKPEQVPEVCRCIGSGVEGGGICCAHPCNWAVPSQWGVLDQQELTQSLELCTLVGQRRTQSDMGQDPVLCSSNLLARILKAFWCSNNSLNEVSESMVVSERGQFIKMDQDTAGLWTRVISAAHRYWKLPVLPYHLTYY